MLEPIKNGSEKNGDKYRYTILAPKSFRAHSNYTLIITVHDENGYLNKPATVRASIEDNPGFKVHHDASVKPNITEAISIPIGDVPINGNYKLVVKGISGIELEHESVLDLQIKTHTIFIQTDKTIYKPSDCIKFRVLTLDSEMKAATVDQNELIITLADPKRDLVKKFDGVNTNNGVFAGEFQLAEVSNLGEWTITAAIGAQMKTVAVDVAEYLPPKLKLSIDSRSMFTEEDGKVCATVIGKDRHGKPLKGTASVSVFNDRWALLIKKKITIDGQQKIEFDIRNKINFVPKGDHSLHSAIKNYRIRADVIETATGLSQSIEKPITIHEKIYKVTANINKRELLRGTTRTITISARKYDGSPIVFNSPDKRKITIVRKQYFASIERYDLKEDFLQLDDKGDVEYTFEIGAYESSFWLQALFSTIKFDVGTFYTLKNPKAATKANGEVEKVNLNVTNLTETCCANKEVEIEVMSNYPLPAYTYLIVGRGRIFEAKSFTPKFAPDTVDFVHRFKFMPNSQYTPSVKVIVYCVRGGKIVSTHLIIDIQDENPKNFIELNVSPDTAKTGQILDISVKSNAKSYIGLVGIDESLLQLRGQNDLCQEDIQNELDLFYLEVKPQPQSCINSWDDFSKAGLITFSNTVKPKRKGSVIGGDAGNPMKRKLSRAKPASIKTIRRVLPDTWIWESIDGNNFNGLVNFKTQVPDSMTTYILTGFSIDPVNGLAITKAQTKLCVQQQFHVSVDLPYSVKRGEIVTVSCMLHSYASNNIDVEVNLTNDNKDFEFMDKCNKKKITIQSHDTERVLFSIRPTKIGLITLNVLASSSGANDRITKTLNVELEGVSLFENKVVFVDLREKSEIDPANVIVDIPAEAVPDSIHVKINCFGDLLASTVQNFEQLIRLQTGCGEQNVINLLPHAIILNYLKNTNQLTHEIEAKAKKVMEIGYQRQLQFKRKDGSFSPFGEADEEGCTWITAFVATSFKKISDYIHIEDHIIENALVWLAETQTTRGNFNEWGNIYHKEMQLGASSHVALSACVLIAFLVNKDKFNKYDELIEKGLKSIVHTVKSTLCSDAYALATVAYCMQLANHSSKKEILDRLLGLTKSENDCKWWRKVVEVPREPKTLNVEITAYGLLAASMNGNDADSLALFKWLLTQRNDLGGFEGTQDTNIGLEALAHFATKIAIKENNVRAAISTSNNENFNFVVTKANALVRQSQQLSPATKSVRVSASGKGLSLFEVSYSYNVITSEKQPSFLIKPNAKLVNEEQLCLEITVAYVAPKGKNPAKCSNMVVLEATLPSGFVVNSNALIKLRAQCPLVKRTEVKNGETRVVLYFEHLTLTPMVLQISGIRLHNVDEKKPASIVVYDYYDSALSAREFYTL